MKSQKKMMLLTAVSVFFALFCLIAVAAQAGRPWVLSGVEEFARGELDGVSVLSSGEMVLSPVVTTVPGIDADFIWDMKPVGNGRFFVATGSPGAVYEIDDGEARIRHKTSEDHILSLLPLTDGSILMATAPRGIIYRIADDGTVTVFADLDVSYVWDMALVGDEFIYCATGPDGRLISLTPDGRAEVVFTAPQSNLLSMTVDEDRDVVYVGTQPGGLVYEIDRDGGYTVLFDAREDEIRDMVLSPDGALYVCTAQSEASPMASRREREPNGSAQIILAGRQGADMLPGQPSVPNSIYRVDPDIGAYRLAEFQDALVLALECWDGGREILAGTGVDGKLVGVRTDGRTRIIADTGSRHVSALCSAEDGNILVGASNPGRLMLLGTEYGREGRFISRAFDSEYLSRWGAVAWLSTAPDETAQKVYVRTGNSASPDNTWSDWVGPAENAAGERLGLPMGRFAQLKIVLESDDGRETPEINQITLHYRQANRRPVIETLAVNGENQSAGRPGASKSPEKTIRWSASDPNKDELEYDLSFRGVDERNWRELSAGMRAETSYRWDTTRVPDGFYLIRLTATDRPSRGELEALQDEKVFGPFLIDNAPPEIRDLDYRERQIAGRYLITGTALDRTSNIASIQVSHNSGDWQPVFPDDGIFDSLQEAFTYATTHLDDGQHVFVFVAEDAAGNTGSQKIIINVGAP